MDTSGQSTVCITLDIVVLALFAGVVARQAWGRAIRRPWTAVGVVVVIGVCSVLCFAMPLFAFALMRDPAETLEHGQWWRVLTALLAQDGGVTAAAFNLVVVAAVVLIGSHVWGSWPSLAIFVGCSVVLNLAALGWQGGGGTSFASDGLLAASAVALAFTEWTPARWGAAGIVAAGIVLVATDDAHGLALLLGAAVGGVLVALARRGGGAPADVGGRP